MSDLTETNQTSSRIGKYQIRRVLGKGAMGIVYEGYDDAIDRRVAIKTLHAHLVVDSGGEAYLERFQREARAAARCVHPNIVAVHEFGEHDDMPFIAMEYVEGEPLDVIVKRQEVLSLKSIMRIVSQVLMALNLAHSKGVIHRDIKPANIMVLPDGQVKLADFGIARFPTDTDLTQTGVAIGTPRFMAPEQLFGQDVDGRSDLFAVSRVLLELFTLLPADTTLQLTDMPEFFGLPASNRIDFRQRIPSAFAAFLEKGMAANPEDRYADVKAYADGLKAVVAHLRQSKSVASTKLTSPIEPTSQLDEAQSQYETQIGRRAGDDTGSGSLTGLDSGVGRSGPLFAGFASQVDEDTLTRLKSDYAAIVGPSASRLVDTHSEDAISFAELIHSLAGRIDDRRKRQRFVDEWSG